MYKYRLIFAMFIFGTIGLFVRFIPLSSSVIAFFRGFIGSLFLLGIRRFKIDFKSIRQSLFLLVLSGIFIGINWILLFESYRYTTIAVSTLCYYFAPILAMIVSVFLFKEYLSLNKILCIICSFIGMILVSGILEISNFSFIEMKGVICALGAAVFYGSVIILNKYIKNIDSYDKTIIQLVSASFMMIIYILFTKEYKYINIDLMSGILLVVVGVVHTGFAYNMYFSSIEHLDSQTIGLFSYLDPIIAVVLSICILNESLSVLSIIGAIMVLSAAIINEYID